MPVDKTGGGKKLHKMPVQSSDHISYRYDGAGILRASDANLV